MQTKDKIDVTLSSSNEITDVTNPDSSCVSSRTEVDDQMTLHKANGIPVANDKYDIDEMDGLLCSDKILEDANTLASFDDPEEYPLLGTLKQSQVLKNRSVN